MTGAGTDDTDHDWIERLSQHERDALASMVMQSLRGSWRAPQARVAILGELANRGLHSFDTERVRDDIGYFKERYFNAEHDGRIFRRAYQEGPDVSDLVDRAFVERYAPKLPDDMTWNERQINREYEGRDTDEGPETATGVLIETYEYPGELPRGCRIGNPGLVPGTYALVRVEDVGE